MSKNRNLKSTLGIRLADKDREQLEQRAQYMGISSSSLVRIWIKEKLRDSNNKNK